ncbi:hypothetical protein ACVWWO_008563 [Bradyrhizobium sp. F1.13.1]
MGIVGAIAAADLRRASNGPRRQNWRSNATCMAWLPKSSRRFCRGAPLVKHLLRHGGASSVSARTLQQANIHRVRTRLRLSQINELNYRNTASHSIARLSQWL